MENAILLSCKRQLAAAPNVQTNQSINQPNVQRFVTSSHYG